MPSRTFRFMRPTPSGSGTFMSSRYGIPYDWPASMNAAVAGGSFLARSTQIGPPAPRNSLSPSSQSSAAAGALTAAELTWWEEPLLRPRRAWGAAPVRFQFSVPEPKRNVLVESLVQRFNQSQKDFEVKVEFVPQAQARQKLISGIAAGNPPDCCQVWDNWVGEFDGMGAVLDLTGKVKDWKHYSDVLPIAWQTVTVKNR